MSDTGLIILCAFSHVIFARTYEVGYYSPVLRIKKLRFRVARYLVPTHKTSKWLSQSLDSGSLTPRFT